VSVRINLPRGLVTFLFTDIEGSTRLARMLGAGYRAMLTEHRRLLRRTLSACGGTPLFSEGDSLFVAFPDARNALVACAEAQRALATHAWSAPDARPLVRMGLHTGVAHPRGGEYATPEVHRAARIAAAAHGSQVLCSAATARHAGDLVGGAWLLDLGLHRLRGFDDRERLFQLVSTGLPRQFPRPRTAAESRHNLPGALTTFVGRRTERAELTGLLSTARLVSVVGPGGVGKTRLAVETAAAVADGYRDGVWFVDLAPVAQPVGAAASQRSPATDVPLAVATALGLRPEPGRPLLDTIVDYAANRRLLLVLDTCDAQPAAAAALAHRLLAGSRTAKVLATSREPLGRSGEVVWRIPPLSLRPDPDGGPSEAVQLLLDRAAAARGGRPLEQPERDRLPELATRLDGLPLALELAAARLRVLSVTELLGRLDDVLAKPSTVDEGRHATLHDAVTWSYRTLPPGAARLMRWLSVFAGRVQLGTVEWLLDEDPLGALSTLVDKSLVQAEVTPSGTTYRMLDPVRGYAARRLAEAGEEATARDRHAAWLLHAIEAAQLGTDGRPAALSMHGLDPLADEVRAALRWSVTTGSARNGLRIAVALDQWWRERGAAREGRDWFFRLYERMAATGEPVPDEELAAAYHVHALHACVDGAHAEALRFVHGADAAAQRCGDPALLVRVRGGYAGYLRSIGELTESERVCRNVIEYAHHQDVIPEALSAVYGLAELLWRRGALDEAAELLAAARPVEAARPAERGRRTVDLLLGLVALGRGDLVAAHEHLAVALRWRVGYGFHLRACEAINALGVRCALAGDLTTAARLFGAARSAGSGPGPASGLGLAYWTAWQSQVRAELGDAGFDAAYAEGNALTLDKAVTTALAVEHPDLAAGSLRFS
jgi:predicted ATPase/class 3 adenylate cyclase